MVVCGQWLCMLMYGHAWLFVFMYGQVYWSYIVMYGQAHVLSCMLSMVLYGHKRKCKKVQSFETNQSNLQKAGSNC